MLLRSYICSNMAWQIKIQLLSVDALHREAVLDSVFRAIPPPQADLILCEKVTEFGRRLTNRLESATNPNEQHHVLAIRSPASQSHSDVNAGVVIKVRVNVIAIVPKSEDVNPTFLSHMQNLSAQQQNLNGQQTDHTIFHMMHSMVPVLAENMGFHYLLESKDGTKGLQRMMLGTNDQDRRSGFKEVMTTDELCDETEAEELATQLENSKNWQGTWESNANATLCEVYIVAWIQKFCRVLFRTMNEFIRDCKNIADIDSYVALTLTMKEMTLEAFEKIFCARKKDSNKSTLGEGNILGKGFRLDPLGEGPVPFVVKDFGASNKEWDPFEGDPFKKMYTTSSGVEKRIPPDLVVMLLTFLYATVSKNSHDRFIEYFSGQHTRFDQRKSDRSEHDEKKRARLNLRCCVLCILSSSRMSSQFWYPGFFRKASGKQGCTWPERLLERTRLALIIISAVRHTTPHYSRMGLNAAMPDWLQIPADLKDILKRGSRAARRVQDDYMPLLTVAFSQQMVHDLQAIWDDPDMPRRRQNPSQKDLQNKDARPLFTRFLDPSLRADLRQLGINGIDTEQVTAVKPTGADVSGVVWLADLSLGGCNNLSMKPDPSLKFPATFESLVQVLGDCGESEATHRIGLFADRANQGGGRNLLDWIWQALKDDSSEGREAEEEIRLDAEETEPGSGTNGGADGGANGGDDGGAASAAEPNGNGSRNNASQELQETGADGEVTAAKENASGEDPEGETKKPRRRQRPAAPISKVTRLWKKTVLPDAVDVLENVLPVLNTETTKGETRQAIATHVERETLVNIGMQLLVITAQQLQQQQAFDAAEEEEEEEDEEAPEDASGQQEGAEGGSHNDEDGDSSSQDTVSMEGSSDDDSSDDGDSSSAEGSSDEEDDDSSDDDGDDKGKKGSGKKGCTYILDQASVSRKGRDDVSSDESETESNQYEIDTEAEAEGAEDEAKGYQAAKHLAFPDSPDDHQWKPKRTRAGVVVPASPQPSSASDDSSDDGEPQPKKRKNSDGWSAVGAQGSIHLRRNSGKKQQTNSSNSEVSNLRRNIPNQKRSKLPGTDTSKIKDQMAAAGSDLTDTSEGSAENNETHLLETQEGEDADDEEMIESQQGLEAMQRAFQDGELSSSDDTDVEGFLDKFLN